MVYILFILDFKFRLSGPFITMQGISLPCKTEEKEVEVEAVNSDVFKEKAVVSEGTQESVSDAVDDNVPIGKLNYQFGV